MPTLNLFPVTTDDYRALAEKRLPRLFFDYVDGGAYDERTLKRNVSDFQNLELKQRVMRDVSKLETDIELFGQTWTLPIALAPIGMAGMMARRAEVQAKRAADSFGIPFCLSTVGICSLEEVAAVSDKPFWFQLYMLKDRGAVQEILQRAKRVGIKGKPHIFGNLADYVPKATTPADFKEWVDGQFDPSVTWKDIDWLRSIWDGNLVIKGVLSPQDAKDAAQTGADGIHPFTRWWCP